MKINNIIKASISQIVNHPAFKAWFKAEQVQPSDWIVINNSFVHRDLSTIKSNYYIVLVCDAQAKLDHIQVATDFNIKTDLRCFRSRQPNLPKLQSLPQAIEQQLGNIGKIVFTLIGYVADNLVLAEKFDQAGFTELVWDPSERDPLRIHNQRIYVNSPYDEEALWNALTQHLQSAGVAFDADRVKQDFGIVLDRLQGRAEASLVLPDKKMKARKGITDAIVEVLRKQREEYAVALSRCRGRSEKDAEAFNQVLRISYNFASDAIPYLRLIVSICDLKPIVLWSTIGEHYALSEAFRNLPWTRSKYKPSLKNYIDIIGDARNVAFHNIFPFQKALRVTLPPNAIQGAELRIFSEYNYRRNSNELTFQDKELVDILLEFTRAKQRPVSPAFWEKNLDVMDKTVALFDATSRALKELHSMA